MREDFYDARYEAAKSTGDRNARERGWCFRPEEPSFMERVCEVLFRPYTITCLVILGACVALLIGYSE